MQVYQKMIIAASLAIGWTELSAVTVSMVPGTSYQNIEGFGGGVVYYQSWATLQDSAVREAIFDTAFTGLGLSIMRMGNWMQNESEGAAVQYDTVVYNALKARRPNAKIFMSSWSAPDSIKANATVNGNGDSRSLNTLDKDSAGNFKYASFAHWWRETYEAYVALGITPDYISIQNEPDMNATYASTILDSVESDSIANYAAAFQAVRDTFTAAGITTPLYGPEPLGIGYNTFQSYMNSLSNLGEAPDGYAFHMYHNGVNDNSSAPYSSPESFRTALKSIGDDYTDAPLIMSEFCHLNQTSPSSYDMISLAQLMQIGFTDGNLAGYINWELLWGDSAAVNGQMISVSKPSSWGGTGTFTVNPEYHAMRHYSRFINPGWSRIEASVSGNDDVSAVAFKNANADSITLVVINAASSTQIPLEEYTVSDFKVSSITQSVTGGDMSKTLTNATCVTLPARSITTIVLVSGDETLSTASCGEETTVIPAYTGTPSGILIDDATVTGTTDWTADGSRGSLGTDTTASGQTVVTLTFADTAQATAGYSNLSFDMSGLSSSFSGCTAVVVAAYNDSSSSISINMSIDDSYVTTSTLAAGSWTSLTFSLAEDDTLGDKLSFNSDGYGPIHIANIYATGCDDDTSSSSDTSDIPTYSGSYTGVTMYDALTEGVSGWWHDASHSVSATAVKTKGGQTVAALTFAGYEQDGSDDYPYANLAYTLDSTADYSSCTGWSASIYATSTVYLNYNINWSYLGTATVSADDDWQTISFDLDDDDSITNGFEFNSDNAGPIYVANVYATGCENDTNVEEIMVSNPEQLQENATGTIYGLDGSRLWSGSLSKAIRGGSLQLSQLRPGLYLVRAGNKIFKAVKR